MENSKNWYCLRSESFLTTPTVWAITDELEKQTERSVMISSVHKALVRLEEKGYLKFHMGGATETRGGRDKRLYILTQAGIKALNQSKELRNAMYRQVPKIVWEG